MKKTILTTVFASIALLTFSQTDTSHKKSEMSKKMPPSSMLPKSGEVKLIYELPKVCDYKVFDENGTLIDQKKGEFIDYTSYKKGTYFVKYENKTETFKHD
jgi:hypothetical protein